MSNFEQMRVANAAGTAINPSREEDIEALPNSMSDALFILKSIRKMLEPLAVQDSNTRQRIVVDSAGAVTVTALPTLANVTTLGTITNNVPSNLVQFNGVDPRYMLMDIARHAYSHGIRSNLVFSA